MASSLGNVSIVHQDEEVALFLVQNRAFSDKVQPAPKVVAVHKNPTHTLSIDSPLAQTLDPVQIKRLDGISKVESNSTGPNSPVYLRFDVFGMSIAWRYSISCDPEKGTAVYFHGPYRVITD